MPVILAFLQPTDWSAIWISVQVATVAATLCLLMATPLGYWLARSKWKARWIVESILNLPLVLPPVVVGFLLLVVVAALKLPILLTWWAALLAAVVVSFPLALRPVQLAFQDTDKRLEQVARTLGADFKTTFVRVTLPLARRGLISGWLLAFARALGEFGATIMVAGNILGETRTIPLAIYSEVNSIDGIRHAWPLVVVSILLSCAALLVGQWLDSRDRRDRTGKS